MSRDDDHVPVVLLDDTQELPPDISDDAALAVRSGCRSLRSVVRFLRARGHRGRNAALEAVARSALASAPPPQAGNPLPAWAESAPRDARIALRLIDTAQALLSECKGKLHAAQWDRVLDGLDRVDYACGWQDEPPSKPKAAKTPMQAMRR